MDFSPDSTRLDSASDKKRVIVWDLATPGQLKYTLDHQDQVLVAKYSPRGDRIATATPGSVQVWGSGVGLTGRYSQFKLLVNISVEVTPRFNTGLLWFNDRRLLVISGNKIKEFDASTGSAVSEWSVPGSIDYSCIALPKHGELIAHSTNRVISICNALTPAQSPATVKHPRDIRSIAFSADDRFLAIAGEGGKITFQTLWPRVSTMPYWVVLSLNNFPAPSIRAGFNPLVPPTPYIQRTSHPNRR